MKTFVLVVVCLLMGVGVVSAADSDVVASNLQVMVLSRTSIITKHSLKVDVANAGNGGEVSLHVVAKNKDGFQVNEVFFTGPIGPGEKKVFTTIATVKNDISDTIDQWEIDRIRKYSK